MKNDNKIKPCLEAGETECIELDLRSCVRDRFGRYPCDFCFECETEYDPDSPDCHNPECLWDDEDVIKCL